MQLILILLASFVSAWIFDRASVLRIANNIMGLSKESLAVMKAPDVDDDRKQKILLSISGKVFVSTLKLSGWIMVILLPFAAIHITEILIMRTTSFAESLGSLAGIGLSLLGFLSYFGAKQIYARFGL